MLHKSSCSFASYLFFFYFHRRWERFMHQFTLYKSGQAGNGMRYLCASTQNSVVTQRQSLNANARFLKPLVYICQRTYLCKDPVFAYNVRKHFDDMKKHLPWKMIKWKHVMCEMLKADVSWTLGPIYYCRQEIKFLEWLYQKDSQGWRIC